MVVRLHADGRELPIPIAEAAPPPGFAWHEVEHLTEVVLAGDSLGVAVDGRHIEAVDRILAIAAERAKEGIYHTSPFSLRFVAPSSAYALDDVWAADDDDRVDHGDRQPWRPLTAGGVRRRLAGLDVRPHWGPINAIEPGQPGKLYPRWDR